MMKLLILGAGGHGRVCTEVARENSWEVAFLDDAPRMGIGGLKDYEELLGKCDAAFVAMGNPELREMWIKHLKDKGYEIATFISEKAVVSKTAMIGEGSIIMGGSVVQTGASIGRGSIISAGAVVDHDATVGEFCHINCNAVIPAEKKVPSGLKVIYGQIYVEEL